MRLLSLLEDERKPGAIWYVLFRQSPKQTQWVLYQKELSCREVFGEDTRFEMGVRDRGNRRRGGGMGRVSTHSAAGGQTQPVGLGRPPYLVIGFMGPVIHSLNMAF
jgi:hypothetical protein